MSDPITFSSTTPNFALPVLFQGQAQKEFYVNQAHFLLDALLHTSIEGVASEPPTSPVAGETWLVGASAVDAWEGRADQLASWTGSHWLYIEPKPGLRLYNKAEAHTLMFDSNWKSPAAPSQPTGGQTVDAEARTAINGIIEALTNIGIIAST